MHGIQCLYTLIDSEGCGLFTSLHIYMALTPHQALVLCIPVVYDVKGNAAAVLGTIKAKHTDYYGELHICLACERRKLHPLLY